MPTKSTCVSLVYKSFVDASKVAIFWEKSLLFTPVKNHNFNLAMAPPLFDAAFDVNSLLMSVALAPLNKQMAPPYIPAEFDTNLEALTTGKVPTV